ncbi:DNA-3-methyladenine glycosylase family protein [Peribacillus sp. SCS-155]|uniref:DNA-3-methyladenine glycosylase family protein n=1 Tax=Peribacillus sedimenti TaxID=3115297 RepID=UPI003906CFE4
MWTELLKVQGPYNFELVLDRLLLDPLHAVDRKSRTVRVPLYYNGEPFIVSVQGTGTIDSPEFLISGSFYESKEYAIERVKQIFHLHLPLQDIQSHFEGTDLKDIFREHRGTAIVLDFDYFGCLVKCIIHQQLNLAFAHTLTERFVKNFGFDLDGVWFYPSPSTTASLNVEQLRELQFSNRKAEYVIGLAKEIIGGRLDLDQLIQKSDHEIIDELVKIRGIGRWTAENFLLFGLGRPNLFPMADIGIQNALKKLYGLQHKPTIDEMETYSRSWSPFLSYASLYLWRSIEKRSE